VLSFVILTLVFCHLLVLWYLLETLFPSRCIATCQSCVKTETWLMLMSHLKL